MAKHTNRVGSHVPVFDDSTSEKEDSPSDGRLSTSTEGGDTKQATKPRRRHKKLVVFALVYVELRVELSSPQISAKLPGVTIR
ncbi:hypothetical protein LTR09_000567 [Extremus antarcticus]|uniref:Uncharacterized protein n=1 Tax=Extremus antarcticus TaxID=702011 RepID=A0AAJ0GJV8_9PEZI|nr:hypothetical protein LTR09_000567 [Extremus antarcticus]